MTRKSATLPPAYFEEKYRADIDPWCFQTSAYEREKYQATFCALTKDKYENALEAGCSIGVFTQLLSPRCKRLLAIDSSATAIEAARLINDDNVVRFGLATLPDEFPKGAFDLIVLSEVLYYFSKSDLERVAQACVSSIVLGGEIILCHWLGETDYPLTGNQASDGFARLVKRSLPARHLVHDDVYRLERFSAC